MLALNLLALVMKFCMVWIVAEADPGGGGGGGVVGLCKVRNTEVYSLHADLSLLICI